MHGYSYPKYLEQAVLHYVIQLDKDKTSMAMLGQLKPSLTLLEELSGTESTAWTSMVSVFLVSAKRRVTEDKPVVKKARVLPDNTLFRMYPTCFQSHEEGLKSADPVKLRTYVRAVVVFFTFCWFSCFTKLRAEDEDLGDSIQINFQSSKNDQFHNGQTLFVVTNDSIIKPVHIIRTYFRLCGFKFGLANGDKVSSELRHEKKKVGLARRWLKEY